LSLSRAGWSSRVGWRQKTPIAELGRPRGVSDEALYELRL
jgi:predicted nucleic acid-binding Zn ribbon protein